jgi:hypothetical protein
MQAKDACDPVVTLFYFTVAYLSAKGFRAARSMQASRLRSNRAARG